MFLLDSPNVYERELKVDRRILDLMKSGRFPSLLLRLPLLTSFPQGGNDVFPSMRDLLKRIAKETGSRVDTSSSFKDRQGNEIPILKVQASTPKGLESASALIMEHLDPHRDKMTFNIDVPYIDHSYIIGKDGSRIKMLSLETGCHIHLPDCNKTSGKKSNKLSIAGTSFESIEKARNQIRKSLPLNIGFKARVKSRKFVHIDTSSSEVQAIKRMFKVDVTFTNVISNNKITEVTINVKGGRAQLEDIKAATRDLYFFVTGEELQQASPAVDFTITIDISQNHHQYVRGKNSCNLRVIHQRTKALVAFPSDHETNQVLIQGKDLLATVMGWQELMGYLPLLLSFDVNFNIQNFAADIQRLEKDFGVGIRLREKLCGHVYTVLIKTQERHSISLQEIRLKILELKSKTYTTSGLYSALFLSPNGGGSPINGNHSASLYSPGSVGSMNSSQMVRSMFGVVGGGSGGGGYSHGHHHHGHHHYHAHHHFALNGRQQSLKAKSGYLEHSVGYGAYVASASSNIGSFAKGMLDDRTIRPKHTEQFHLF